MKLSEHAKIAQKVTLVGMILDLVLGFTKITIGLLFYSYSLVTDGIHSLSDAVTDVFVLIITRISSHGPDEDHPYGHARFETMGTVLLGSTLIIIAIILAYQNISILYEGKASHIPGWPTLVVAGISILSKEWIFHYTKRAGEKLKSNLLIANAWHSRTDAFSSIIVLIGVAGTMLGVPWLDGVAAIFVAIIIAKVGWELVITSLTELVDTGLTADKIADIQNFVLQHEGVCGVHDLRTRHMGQDVFIELHIRVNQDISVSEGHHIGEWVHKKLMEKYAVISNLTYHIDVEDDHITTNPEQLLPLRAEVIDQLKIIWKSSPVIAHIKMSKLHYLNHHIDIELFLICPESEVIPDLATIHEHLKATSAHLNWVGNIKVWAGPHSNLTIGQA